jgi:hypothetical protein
MVRREKMSDARCYEYTVALGFEIGSSAGVQGDTTKRSCIVPFAFLS